MNWIRRQINEILGLFFLSFGVTPTDEMKEQLGIAKRQEHASSQDVQEEPRQDSSS